MHAEIFSSTGKAVAIFSKPGHEQLITLVPELLNWFHKHGYEVVVDRETSSYAPSSKEVPREEMATRQLSFVVVLGGDGTLLSAARAVAKAGIPVMGVNLGSLGFLAEVPVEDVFATLQSVEDNCCQFETRAMIHCDVFRKDVPVGSYDALNDVVVGKSTVARLNHCDVHIDGAFVSSYQADSLIISTPTGSTAYSLAAGGPILVPSVEAIVITPVAEHSLTHRALVVRDTSQIEIVAKTGLDEAYLSVDGQIGIPLYDGDLVRCKKSEYKIKLLRFQGTFFDALRAKLKWGRR